MSDFERALLVQNTKRGITAPGTRAPRWDNHQILNEKKNLNKSSSDQNGSSSNLNRFNLKLGSSHGSSIASKIKSALFLPIATYWGSKSSELTPQNRISGCIVCIMMYWQLFLTQSCLDWTETLINHER